MRTVSDSDRKFRFTDTRLEAWPLGEREVCLFDQDKPNLVLRVRGRSKNFYYWRTDAKTGKTAKVRIGRLGEWTVAQARNRVDELNGATAATGGAVPKRDRPRDATLGDAWDAYISNREAEGGRSTYQQKRMYELYLKRFAHVRMEDIDDEWVKVNVKLAVVSGEGLDERRKALRRSGGTYTANNVLNMLRGVFRDYLTNTKDAQNRPLSASRVNPCANVSLYPRGKKDACMNPAEVRRFIAAIDTFKREHCHYKHTRPGRGMFKGEPIESRLALADVLLLCVTTGQRRGAVASMRWADLRLDSDRPVWRIPPLKGNKSNKRKTVHLPPKVVELLLERRERCGDGVYVFPGARGAERVKDPRKVFHKVLEIAGIRNPDLDIHSLRAAYVTFGFLLGKSANTIAKAVGHDSPDTTTEHYMRLSEDQTREVAMDIAAAMYAEEDVA